MLSCVLWFLGKFFPTCTPRVEDDLGLGLPRCWDAFSCVAVSVLVFEKAFVLPSFLCVSVLPRGALLLQVVLQVVLDVVFA